MYRLEARGQALRRSVLRWFGRHGRDLPWRKTQDPYRILVSEVMLQQTQVARVLPAYRAFLRRFPSLRALARASLSDVLVTWGGLGYPRRARDLHRIARAAAQLPGTVSELEALPGVGAYTAGAVACFSSGAAVPFADTNIRRVLGRALLGRTATPREAVEIDAALMPRSDPARWHHALMDIGATICVARAPRCASCPIHALCIAKGVDAVPPRRRQRSFATSDRRVRGAIMRILRARHRGMGFTELRRSVADPRLTRLVTALVAEGLVERSGTRVRLPR